MGIQHVRTSFQPLIKKIFPFPNGNHFNRRFNKSVSLQRIHRNGMSSVNRPLYERILDAVFLYSLALLVVLYSMMMLETEIRHSRDTSDAWSSVMLLGVLASFCSALATSCLLEPYSRHARDFQTWTAISKGYSGNYFFALARDLLAWTDRCMDNLSNLDSQLIRDAQTILEHQRVISGIVLKWLTYWLACGWCMIRHAKTGENETTDNSMEEWLGFSKPQTAS
ncbi:hypothetical protein J3F84DRAFT_362244 [Trichoderma pleuroticola]